MAATTAGHSWTSRATAGRSGAARQSNAAAAVVVVVAGGGFGRR